VVADEVAVVDPVLEPDVVAEDNKVVDAVVDALEL
jgi:hypothetical protein